LLGLSLADECAEHLKSLSMGGKATVVEIRIARQ